MHRFSVVAPPCDMCSVWLLLQWQLIRKFVVLIARASLLILSARIGFSASASSVGWSGFCSPQLPDCTVCTEAMAVENSNQVPCCGQFVHTVCLDRFFSSRGVDCPFCNQSLADFARSSSFLASSLFHGCVVDLDRAPSHQAIDSLVTIFLLHLQSILSVAPVSVALPSSNLWMTVVWKGHLFTRPFMAPRRGFLSGSVALVEHPFRFLTSLHWIQIRALSVLLHPPSCLTDPLAAQCVSASPVSVWCPLHYPPVTRWIGSRMVLSRVSTHYNGWGSSRSSPPGSGTQSWLFCPLPNPTVEFFPIPPAIASKFPLSNPSSGAPMLPTSSKRTPPICLPSTVKNLLPLQAVI